MDVHCLELAGEEPSAWGFVAVMCATIHQDIAPAPAGDEDHARAESADALQAGLESKGLLWGR